MPELPEVETTKRGLEAYLLGKDVVKLRILQRQLRWPITRGLAGTLQGRKLIGLSRRGKYLLFAFEHGTLIAHLGMSGSFRILGSGEPLLKHDHVCMEFSDNYSLRFNDPRRFGSILWTTDDPLLHPLLIKLGPEPLGAEFNANYLLQQCQKRKLGIKQIIMNSHIVVGVGNIYASEALFAAKIHPLRLANTLTKPEGQRLTRAIKSILKKAITSGGTTLKDFTHSDGKPGYFKQQLKVYDRLNQPCHHCKTPVELIKINNRSTYLCPQCQKSHS